MKSRPDIILLVMDTARKKSMSVYGHGRPTTPNLERFAGECMVYDNAISPSPWTVPAHASIFSGLYPSQHGLHSANLRYWKREYDLPGLLRRAGYRTYGLSANSLIGDTLGFSETFDRFERLWQRFQVDGRKGAMEHHCVPCPGGKGGRFPAFTEHPADFVKSVANKLMERALGGVMRDATPSTVRGLGRSIGIIREHQAARPDTPYFLFLNVLQPHEVYNPPEEYRERFAPGGGRYPGTSREHYSGKRRLSPDDFGRLTRLYEAEVAFMDFCIGRWLDALRSLPSYGGTAVVLVSDHGEHVGEHGHLSHEFSLYQELVDVPLMVKYPGGVRPPGRDGRLVQSHDLFPTLLELAGLEPPEPPVAPGGPGGASVSLLTGSRDCAVSQLVDVNLWLDGLKQYHPEFDAVAFPYKTSQFACFIKEDGALYKWVGHGDGTRQVYELDSDPGELVDVCGSLGAGTLQRIESRAADEMARLGFGRQADARDGDGEQADEAVTRQLRGLGYI
ncbi:MAG: sulfatase-like hydrolase/transferase [Nitrospirae bacterium]|nr:sulfatase-like hydrolase/transferase [Nitrospirota bacterium]